ncbi:GNAT family N-acetyltransferase [Allokutzneria sp. A3M-2-11 16]|uniref:GNAT family N-acetyltransferase n=1 Tax=Allokutzneria sp. A3M-2-11 16 TaxID=2962043 RepID=UPI0020B773CD|nr:GNAT family N-acetyltransferase [Allokutzneria sp. A3M-2-11 16]MCP3801141.1 GNAT family N-acetyltransferase [Allokutzneria sp. A3M-2-11 16]
MSRRCRTPRGRCRAWPFTSTRSRRPAGSRRATARWSGSCSVRCPSYDEREDWGYLEWIAVDPAHQGRGLAGKLLDACCGALFAEGATRIVTDVEASNVASATLMQRNGFSDRVTVTLFVRHAEPAGVLPGKAHRSAKQPSDPAKARLRRATRSDS